MYLWFDRIVIAIVFFPFAQSRELLIPGLIIPDDIVHLRDRAITGSDPTFLEKLTYNANDNYSSQAVQSARNDHVHVRSFNDEPVSSSTLFFNYRANILFLFPLLLFLLVQIPFNQHQRCKRCVFLQTFHTDVIMLGYRLRYYARTHAKLRLSKCLGSVIIHVRTYEAGGSEESFFWRDSDIFLFVSRKGKKKNKNLFRSNSLWRVFFFFSFSNYLRLKTDRWNLKNFLSLESFTVKMTVKITLRVVVRELSRWISPHDTAEISRLMEKDWELFFGYFSLYRINFIHRFRAYLLLDNSILNVNAF